MNSVLILFDDLDAASLAAAMPRMPRLAEIVARGTTFERFFVTTPVCAPSRSTLLTGRYPHTTGCWRGYKDFGPWEGTSLAPRLAAHSVRTGLYGKYVNGYPPADNPTYVPPGWNKWAGLTTYGYLGYTINVDGTIRSPAGYQTDDLATRAATFASRRGPYLCYVPVAAPHATAAWPPRDDAEFVTGGVARTPAFNEADVSDKPTAVATLPLLDDATIATVDAEYRDRLRTLPAVDDLIGRIVEAVTAAGTFDQTLFLIASDNGYQLGEHRLIKKGVAYDQSIRVPLIVAGPGVIPNRVESRIALMTDLAPTLLDLHGAPPDPGHDGRSLRPLLAGDQSLPWRTAGLIEDTHWKALRSADTLYVEYTDGERELYDLTTDGEELENAITTADPGRVAALSARLAALKGCAAGTCRVAEDAA